MEKIIKILMKRDELTYEEAQDLVNETRVMMEECNYDSEECVDIMQDMLGLEPDYIMDILGF